MEISKAESQKIRSLIDEWFNHPEQELEATFEKGEVDVGTFLNIAQRLRSKGFTAIPMEDRLSILLPENIRVLLVGTGVIQNYCREEHIVGKPYVAMIKDRTVQESELDFDEYNVRVKVRRESPLSKENPVLVNNIDKWDVLPKAFRLLRRWSFQKKGIRFDLSMVRSTRRDRRGDYKKVRNFGDENIFKAVPTYEVEVELVRSELDNIDESYISLIQGIGEVLRGIQKNSLLIRASVADRVLRSYAELTGTDQFRGVAPITLERKNMIAEYEDGVPNIRRGYNVTDKADGLRVLGYCNKDGELFLIDMARRVYRTGLTRRECRDSLLDCEWITRDRADRAINLLMTFDVYYVGGEKVDTLPFIIPGTSAAVARGEQVSATRHDHLTAWITEWNKDDGPTMVKGVTSTSKLNVSKKNFFAASEDAPTVIFQAAARILEADQLYHTDGLIFTPNASALPQKPGETFTEQFKWKPADENTIDFLVNFEKDAEYISQDKVTVALNDDTQETVRFKTLRLYVGSSKDAGSTDPRSAILYENMDPRTVRRGGVDTYKPVLFNPIENPDTMANVCYCSVETDPETGEEYIITNGTKEQIRDRTIVEMEYDPSEAPGWRWKPMRVRHDKSERLAKGILARTLNSAKVAESVWNSIHDPITLSMIRTGAEQPLAEEIADLRKSRGEDVERKYYQRSAAKEDLLLVSGLRAFHNEYIKGSILYRNALRRGSKVFDVACGKAGDIQKWRMNGASFVFGVDYAGDNIRDPRNGAYARYWDMMKKFGRQNVPQMVFAIGNSSKRIMNGDAGGTPEERDIMRSIMGRIAPEGPIPKYISSVGAGALSRGAELGVCMFALHYFFETLDTLNGFLQNLADGIAVGGYFIGCCFDGQALFDMLAGLPKGGVRTGAEDGRTIWEIRKEYEIDSLEPDDTSVGLPVDVQFISIGTEHREYLMNFAYFQKRMAAIGFELINAKEAAAFRLKSGSEMFGRTYDAAIASGKKYDMSPMVKEFSFLNRWFIFRRRSSGEAMEEVPQEEVVVEDNVEMPVDEGAVIPSVAPVSEQEIAVEAPVSTTTAVNKTRVLKLPTKKTVTTAAPEEAPLRTIPVGAMLTKGKYEVGEIFQVGMNTKQAAKYQLSDPQAAYWIAPSAPFPIRDPDDASIEYPTVLHFLAGMKLKMGTNKPQLGETVMSRTGSIHEKMNRQRLKETAAGIRPLDAKRDIELLKEELEEVALKSTPQAIRGMSAQYNEGAWLAVKDAMLKEAVKQRWERDVKFYKIVEEARSKGKYILYFSSERANELAGKRMIDGRIEGDNRYGRAIMEIANF